MKCWTILVLLALVCAVFLGGARSEEAPERRDFQRTSEDAENEELAHTLKELEHGDNYNDDETEKMLESIYEKSNDDDEEKPEIFKRGLWRRLRRSWFRRLIRRLRKRLCKRFRKVCRVIRRLGDEEFGSKRSGQMKKR